MFNEIIRILKQGSILSLGRIGHGALQFLLLPIYTRLLNPDDFGILEMLTIFSSIISLIILMGIRQGFTRNYLLKEKNISDQDYIKNQKKIISTTILFLFIWGTFFSVSTVFFAPQISNILLKSIQYDYLIVLSSFWALGLALCQVYQAYFINNSRIKTYVVISTIQLATNLLLALYWVVLERQGIQGVIKANFIANILFGVFTNLWIVLNNKAPFRLTWLKKMLRFGIPSMIGILLLVSFDIIDRLFLNHYLGLSNLGIYSIGRKVVLILSLSLVGPFMGIWTASMYRIANLINHKEIYSRILILTVFGLSFSCLALSLFSEQIILLLTSTEYIESKKVVIWLSMAQTAYIISTIMMSGMNIVGKSEYGIPLNIITLIIGITLNFILVPNYGIVGASVATFFTFLSQALLFYLLSQKLYHIPFPIIRTVFILVITFILYFVIMRIKIYFPNILIGVLINTVALILILFISRYYLFSHLEREKLFTYLFSHLH